MSQTSVETCESKFSKVKDSQAEICVRERSVCGESFGLREGSGERDSEGKILAEEGPVGKEMAQREPPVPSFFLRSVPVYEEQDPFQYYDFTTVAGRGGYATVYIVQHLESGERYACKIVHTKDNEQYVERALKEACMQSILNDHPNVTTLKEVWTFGLKHVFLIMERSDGGEIYDAIVSRGALPEKDSANVLRVILQLIRYCHCKGLIHHDIKPENLMLTDKDKPLDKSNIRCIDFGCTAFYDEATKKLSGTPLYAAPEIIKGPNHDYRSDLWSAGVFLFCMLTGLMPFEGETNQDVKQAVLSQPIDFEEDPWPFVAEEAKDLCKRLLQRSPEKRISLDDALTHPWLKQHCLDEAIETLGFRSVKELVAGLQSFTSKTPLQRLLLLLYAHKFGAGHKERAACFRLFDWMDRDGNGKMSLNTFRHGMQGLDADFSEIQIKEVFTSLLQINEARIMFVEFHAATLDLQFSECPTLDDLLSEMSSGPPEMWDSASIKIDSLRGMLPKAGGEFSKAMVDKLKDHTDSEGHECVSRHKLQAAWDNCIHRDDFLSSSRSGSMPPHNAIDMELQQVWQQASLRSDHSSVSGSSPPRGCSPATESSWDRMKLVRGGSPVTVGYTASENGMGSSPTGTTCFPQGFLEAEQTGQEGFCSGGVMYWDGTESHPYWEEEDSDSLFGPALAAIQARHP